MKGTLDSLDGLIISGIMGILGGLVTIPFNTLFAWFLKRDEQDHQYKLDMKLKKFELIQRHKLECEIEVLKHRLDNLDAWRNSPYAH